MVNQDDSKIEKAQTFNLEAVTKANLEETLAYINKIFEVDSHAIVPGGLSVTEASLRESIEPGTQKQYLEYSGIQKLEYFILRDDQNKIVGSIGYYTCTKDADKAGWLGWFSIDPSIRGKGYGKSLLKEVENLAKARGKKYLRLYTSDDPNEAAAQILYEKVGLAEIGRHKEKNYPYSYIYREKKLENSTNDEILTVRKNFRQNLTDIAGTKF